MNNSTITPATFDLGAWGNTSSFFLDSLNLGGESVEGDGLFRDKNRQKPSYLKPFGIFVARSTEHNRPSLAQATVP